MGADTTTYTTNYNIKTGIKRETYSINNLNRYYSHFDENGCPEIPALRPPIPANRCLVQVRFTRKKNRSSGRLTAIKLKPPMYSPYTLTAYRR